MKRRMKNELKPKYIKTIKKNEGKKRGRRRNSKMN